MDINEIKQVDDDQELLELMLGDSSKVSPLYKPTNYWTLIDNSLIPELRSSGLHDFRRRKGSLINFFSITDQLPISRALQKTPSKKPSSILINLLFRLSFRVKKLQRIFNSIANKCSGVSLQDIDLLCFEIASLYGEKTGARPIRDIEASYAGNPEHVFFVGNKMYNISLLFHYIHYAYCCQFMNFSSINTVTEIGSGFGKQIEVIKKLHPQLTFYLFDLAPQLYVCHQYLSKVFPNSVVSYRETRKMNKIPEDNKGKIFFFGNWKISELSNLSYDLFWNSASFQEMEPDVVLNYLNFVNKQTQKYVFLQERLEGSPKAPEMGKEGVLEQTKLEHYKKGLPDFHLKNMSRPLHIPKMSEPSYTYTFWSKE